MEKGILYKATGDNFVEEATYSAKSAKEAMPELPTAIVTDHDISSDYFDIIIKRDHLNDDNSSGIIEPDDSPFRKTLKLDTDMYVHKPVTELFDLLDQYDLVVSHGSSPTPGMGDPYVMFNPAIMVYNEGDEINKILQSWKSKYWKFRNEKKSNTNAQETLDDKYRKRKSKTRSNMPSFSKSIYESSCDLFILPNWYVGGRMGFLSQDVKIIHDRPLHTKTEVAEKLNSTNNKRVYYLDPCLTKGDQRVNMYSIPASNKDDPIVKRTIDSIKMNGFVYTIKAALFDVLSNVYSRRYLKRTKN